MTAFRLLCAAACLAAVSLTAPARQGFGPSPTEPAKQEVKTPNVIPPERAEVQIIPVKHTAAVELAEVLAVIYTGERAPAVKVTADSHTNSLLIRAPASHLNDLRAVIEKLDVAPRNEPKNPRIQVLPLGSVTPNQVFERAMAMAVQRGTYAIDQGRKAVILQADEATGKAVAQLIANLETRSVDRPINEMQVRLVWLSTGPAPDGNHTPPPDDIKEVLPALAKMGIDKPWMAGQILVNVLAGAEFESRGNARHALGLGFSISGQLNAHQDGHSLSIVISSGETISLRTDVSATPGHLIVLGLTPTGDTTSAFVLQVTRR